MTERITSDVFVVGSGPCGAVFARELVPRGRRVVVVDAGPSFSARPGWNLKNAHVYRKHPELFAALVQGLLHPLSAAAGEAAPPLVNPRQPVEGSLTGAATGYAVGGMAIHWTGVIPRQHPTMERSPLLSDAEWDTLYGDAEACLTKTDGLFEGSARHRAIRERLAEHYAGRLEPGREVGTLPMAIAEDATGALVVAGSDTVLAPLLMPDGGFVDGLELRDQHAVTRLHIEGGRVRHAEGVNLATGEPFIAEADHFVLAAGTVLSAQLLHASGHRLAANGRYLIEHPIAFGQVHLDPELVEAVTPIAEDDRGPNVWIPVGEGRPWHVQVTKDVVHFSEVPADLDDRLVTDLRWYTLIEPREHQRVSFEDDLPDALGLPRPTFAYRLDDDMNTRIAAMMEDQAEAGAALGDWVTEPRMLDPGICLHLQGATRMGEDDRTSVVDTHGRVWGLDNLQIAGNGVIPSGNACNPTLTSVALALRAARHLRRS
jgi:choline dehydrogenase-like flavoprotein